MLLLTFSAPRVGSGWTDSGSAHEKRHLKHRARNATRPVPIPPELVTLICDHLQSHGAAADGRLFHGHQDAMSSSGTAGDEAPHDDVSA